MTGSGSTWTNSDALYVGLNGAGTPTIETGGSVSNSSGNISNSGRSTGTVIVAGIGSTWTNTSALGVGTDGKGALEIRDGGKVENTFASIGFYPGSTGTVMISGADSQWFNSSELTVGAQGNGRLYVTAGGKIKNTHVSVGRDADSTGTVLVDGPGSTWTTTGDLGVGNRGSGTLSITSGGRVSSANAILGLLAGSVGTVNIDGPGSSWTNSGDLTVGAQGTSTLTVSNCGTVAASGFLSIEPQGTVKGDGNLSGNIANRGLVSPGTSTGALHINGIYIQTPAGKLAIELGGTVSETGYDQLEISGGASLNGTLQVSLINGFAPSTGAAFDILDWGSLSGAFSTVMLPTLGAGLSWDVSQLYTTGVLGVITTPAFTADFDEDGDVDGDDLTQWQGDFGVNGLSDADNDGDSDGADFLTWQRQIGSGLPAIASSAAVSEPATLVMLLVAAAAIVSGVPERVGKVGNSMTRDTGQQPTPLMKRAGRSKNSFLF